MNDTPSLLAAARRREENIRVVLDFYERGLMQRDFEAASVHFGPRYIQHNPLVADGPEGFRAFLQYLREKLPNSRSEIKRVIADDKHVVVHVLGVPEPGDRGLAIVDIFRVEDGKVVGYGDVMQSVPETAANANGMF
jgi:predicted SnoaL-like aldol condensation-catalyzing enzyme